MSRPLLVASSLLLLSVLLPAPVAAQATGAPGTLYLTASPVVIGNTVPCDSATYTMVETVPSEAKAYTARSFGGSACTTNMDFTTPRAFVATAPITVRAVMACDQAAASAGVNGATTSVRFIVLHGTKNLSGNVNLVGSNTCNATPLVFQANIDLKGEEFDAGDLLRVQVIPFYTSGGAGDPVKSLHLKAGGADPTHVLVPDLGGAVGDAAVPVLYQNVTGETLRVGRENASALDQVEVYNWTAAFLPRVTHVANVTGGNVSIQVMANNATLLNLTLSTSGNATQDLASGGNLTVRLTYSNFTGSLVLSMAAPPAGSAPAGPKGTTSTTGTASGGDAGSDGDEGTDGNATKKDASEDAPAPGPLVIALAIALLAWVSRRRLT